MRLLVLLLLATPISAQQTVVVPDVVVPITVSPTPFVNNITVMSDSAMIANLAENNRLLQEMLVEERECSTCGGGVSTTVVGLSIFGPLLFWIAIELRGIKNKETIHNTNVNSPDVNVQVHKHEHKEDSEN